MGIDKIITVEIDEYGRLHMKPSSQKFAMIYRTATEVHWDLEKQTLYSPKPTDWSYVDWYNHILKIVKNECFCELYLTEETSWINIPENIIAEIKVQ